ncbi:MAG TPA: hypothetical protein VGS19_14690 [Streptosporangiaceae bacterium]|nr:hypothetical protein [Streptosporangiaceae bacterium]
MRLRKLHLRQRFLVVILAVCAPVALVLGFVLPGSANAAPQRSTTTTNFVTFYGWTDNSPPGPGIAHPCIHQNAGGVGTRSNPVTMAWPNDLNGPFCQIGYVPFLKKYFIHEDQCNPCGGVNSGHWDLWMGGDRNSTHGQEHTALLACEGKWTTHATVILNPPANLPVDTTPLFTPPTTCHGGAGDGGGGGS